MNTGLARCPRCGAYDPWEDGVRRTESLGMVVLEHRCGVCRQTWRVPIRRPITIEDVK